METITLKEGEEFIRLGQALKKAGAAYSGAKAKEFILSGGVKVNGVPELRRGRKLYARDTVSFDHMEFQIVPCA